MRYDQRNRLRTSWGEPMALSFFHGGQLARGVQAQEGEGSSQVRSLRRLYSETALQEQHRSEIGSQRSFTPSRPLTSQRGDYKSTRIGEEASGWSSRPATSYQNRHGLSLHPPDGRPGTAGGTPAKDPTNPFRSQTTITAHPPLEGSSRWDNLKASVLKNVKKPSFISLRREPAQQSERPKTPKSPVKQSWKKKQAEKRKRLADQAWGPEEEEGHRQPPQRTISRQSVRAEEEARQPPQRTASKRSLRSEHSIGGPVTAPPPLPGRVDTPAAAQAAPNPGCFLAESLAHVIVGEWLYKDPHKPGLFPQSNILQRHLGPPPRGATGVPQRRWFSIDPYQRLLTWSSKWDGVETSQHKQSRKVFEVPNRLSTDGCIPAHVMPYNYSLVVVAPSKMIKLTAPDEMRHNQWLTALQYLVESNKKVTTEAWPDILAARLAYLTQPMEELFDEQMDVHSRAGTPVIGEKPLPPSPPPERTSVPASMVPPPVPRFPHHIRDQSAGLSTMPDSDYSDRGSKAGSSIKSQRAEPYTPQMESKEKMPAKLEFEQSQAMDQPAMDHMEALLSRLS